MFYYSSLSRMLSIIAGIIIGIIILFFLVIIHEFGHFFTAKKSGVQVLEFGLGIPPKACTLGKDKKGTVYTLNRIPLGGFVRLRGEDPTDKADFHAKDSFMSASFWKKFCILMAGIGMNFLFARILLVALFSFGTKPFFVLPENITKEPIESYIATTVSLLVREGFLPKTEEVVTIDEVLTGGLAQIVGIETGDVILKINETAVSTFTINGALHDVIGEKAIITYAHSGEVKQGEILCPTDNCILGVKVHKSDKEITAIQQVKIKFPVHIAMGVAAKEIRIQTKNTFAMMGTLGKNILFFQGKEAKEQVDRFSGPVGLTKVLGDILEQKDIARVFIFMAMISIALGAFNLLPIPALDGGRLLGVIIQTLFRLPKEKYFVIEGYINMFFFILLMGMGVYIIFKDLGAFWHVSLPFIG